MLRFRAEDTAYTNHRSPNLCRHWYDNNMMPTPQKIEIDGNFKCTYFWKKTILQWLHRPAVLKTICKKYKKLPSGRAKTPPKHAWGQPKHPHAAARKIPLLTNKYGDNMTSITFRWSSTATEHLSLIDRNLLTTNVNLKMVYSTAFQPPKLVLSLDLVHPKVASSYLYLLFFK